MDIVSVFSGAGGADIGSLGGFTFANRYYEKTGNRIVLSIDNNQHCWMTISANLGHPALLADITKVTDFPNHDMLIGGFPCQPFSMAGKKEGLLDTRGQLFMEMVRILKEKQPSFFIAENVKGLLSANKGEAFRTILANFEAAGYKLKWQVVDASHYEVPQKRKRLFIIGVRNDINWEYHFPVRSPHKVVIGDVIDRANHKNNRLVINEAYYREFIKNPKHWSKGRILHEHEQMLTITTRTTRGINSTDPHIFTPEGLPRRMTHKEMAAFQSFPDGYWFSGGKRDREIQIGNAIPPVLMWHIIQPFQQFKEQGK